MRRSRFAFGSAILVALSMSGSSSASAQDTLSENFINIGTYTIGFPVGDLRRYTSPVSWLGTGWEGQWKYKENMSKGITVTLHDFTDLGHGTTTFPRAAVTGSQVREVVMMTVMGTGRWYYGNTWGKGFNVGLSAGGEWDQQYYQVGISPDATRSALHLAISPDIGYVAPFMEGVDLVINARFMVPVPGGSYLGGGSRSFQFVALSFGMAER